MKITLRNKNGAFEEMEGSKVDINFDGNIIVTDFKDEKDQQREMEFKMEFNGKYYQFVQAREK